MEFSLNLTYELLICYMYIVLPSASYAVFLTVLLTTKVVRTFLTHINRHFELQVS